MSTRSYTPGSLAYVIEPLYQCGLTENDGHENDGPSKLQGMKLQAMKMTDQVAGMKLQDMKMTDQVAGHEIAGRENDGPSCRT